MSQRRWGIGDLIGISALISLVALLLVVLFWIAVALLLLYPIVYVLVLSGRWLIRWSNRRRVHG